MRYYMRVILKVHQNGKRTNFSLDNKKWIFWNFSFYSWQFSCPLRKILTKYFILKLKLVVKNFGLCGTLTLWNALLKISVLLHKMLIVCKHLKVVVSFEVKPFGFRITFLIFSVWLWIVTGLTARKINICGTKVNNTMQADFKQRSSSLHLIQSWTFAGNS